MPLSAYFFDRSTQYAYYCAPMADTLIPEYVDARKIFAHQANIEGIVPVERLTRFCEGLSSNEGQVNVSLGFDFDERHRRIISGKLSTEVSVKCQRCLEPTQITLSDSFRIALVETEEQIDKLPKDLEPWMSLDTKLVLADILEEQLILCMPIVSYHDHVCYIGQKDAQPANSSGAGPDKPNPFAVLQKLKDK